MHAVTRRIPLCAALAVLVATLSPPLAGWAQHLFAAHMAQHLLLIACVAPLLALSGLGERLAHWASPVAAWSFFVCLFLFWHWPEAFRWAAAHDITGLLELASILLAATLFWSMVLPPRAPLSGGAGALYVMTAAIATDLPGVIMIFAPRAICTMPQEAAGAWNVSPLQDQQLAGLLMWVPANLVFFSIAVFLLGRWMSVRSAPQQWVAS